MAFFLFAAALPSFALALTGVDTTSVSSPTATGSSGGGSVVDTSAVHPAPTSGVAGALGTVSGGGSTGSGSTQNAGPVSTSAPSAPKPAAAPSAPKPAAAPSAPSATDAPKTSAASPVGGSSGTGSDPAQGSSSTATADPVPVAIPDSVSKAVQTTGPVTTVVEKGAGSSGGSTHTDGQALIPGSGSEPPASGGLAGGTILDPIAPITDPVSTILDPIAPILDPVDPIVQSVAPAVEPVAEVIAPIVPALAPVVEATKPIVEAVAPTAPTLEPIVEQIGRTVKPIVEQIAPAVQTIEPVVDKVTTTVAPLTPMDPPSDPPSGLSTPLETIAKTVAPLVQPALQTAQPVIDKVATTIVPLTPPIDPPMDPPSGLLTPLETIIAPSLPAVKLPPVTPLLRTSWVDRGKTEIARSRELLATPIDPSGPSSSSPATGGPSSVQAHHKPRIISESTFGLFLWGNPIVTTQIFTLGLPSDLLARLSSLGLAARDLLGLLASPLHGAPTRLSPTGTQRDDGQHDAGPPILPFNGIGPTTVLLLTGLLAVLGLLLLSAPSLLRRRRTPATMWRLLAIVSPIEQPG